MSQRSINTVEQPSAHHVTHNTSDPDPLAKRAVAPLASLVHTPDILSDQRVHRRGNAAIRQVALLQLQRTQGNQAAVRWIQRASRAVAPQQRLEPAAPARLPGPPTAPMQAAQTTAPPTAAPTLPLIRSPRSGSLTVQRIYEKWVGTSKGKKINAWVDKSQEVLNSAGFRDINTIAQDWVRARAQDPLNRHQYTTLDSIWKEAETATNYTAEGFTRYKPKTRPHDKNWEQYVATQTTLIAGRLAAKKPPPPALGADLALWANITQWSNEAKAAAQLLDTLSGSTVYKVAPAVIKTPGIEGAAPKLNEPQKIERRLLSLWGEVHKAEQLTGGGARIPKPLIPRWGSLNAAGAGSWVDALFEEESTYPTGSGASGTLTNTGWEKPLSHRGYDLNANDTIYVRGHLLNDHLGGPSAPYNLVPLTGTATTTSNDANGEHVAAIEGSVKEALRRLVWQRENPIRSPSAEADIASIRYTVVAAPPASARANTLYIRRAHAHLKELLDDNLMAGTDTVDHLRTQLVGGQVITDTNWTDDLKDAVDAVVPLNERATTSLTDLLKRMDANAMLWQFEDLLVPAGLVYTYVISPKPHPFGGTSTPPRVISGTIANKIPQHRTAPLVKRNAL